MNQEFEVNLEWILRLVEALPQNQRTIIQLFYGLEGEVYKTNEIARILGRTQREVREARKSGFHLLRLAIARPEIDDVRLSELLHVARMRKQAGPEA